MTAPTRPVLRYHGGKWILAPWIISHLPPHEVYVEPFGGAASVLLRKAPARVEVYNDLDAEVVNLFRVLRDPSAAAQLEAQLRLTPYSRREFRDAYEATENPVERARRTVVRAAMSFGTTSLRLNRTGFRATPWRSGGQSGVDDWMTYPDAMRRFTERMRGVMIEERDAIEVIRQQDSSGTLFYVDPPYVYSTRTSVRGPTPNDRAYRHNLTDADHASLAAALHAARGMVVLSGYACPLYDEELYRGWRRETRQAKTAGGSKRTEVLWINPAADEALRRVRAQHSLLEVPA